MRGAAPRARAVLDDRARGPAWRDEPVAGEPHPEEGAAPFVHHRVDGLDSRGRERVDDLARCVACAAERRRELLVGALGAGRRSQPERVLRRDVQPVLMAAKLVERVVVEQGGGARERLEPDERVRDAAPEGTHLARVPLLGSGASGVTARILVEHDRLRSRFVNARPGPVLLVEDDPALRLLCRINLELEHFQVAEAATLDEAREAVATARPAVVFLDMHLGPVPSDDLLDELLGARIPVVLVSGTTEAPTATRVAPTGC